MLVPALTAAFLGYFGFHALSGSYGILARGGFESQAQELEAELMALQADRAELETRAALLRPAGLDPDMIDELARRDLNVIAPNEFVIVP
jgi:cell division protein FtsB